MEFTNLIMSAIAVLICIAIHEFGHALMAFALGDQTAKESGRLTINPFSHLDPVGFLALLFFGFGWAKPVPVSLGNIKNKKFGMALIALAGPMSNFLLSLAIYLIVTIFGASSSTVFIAFAQFALRIASISTGLAVFNLLPIPPLDGSKIFFQYFPQKWRYSMAKYQQFIQFGLILALWLGILNIPLAVVHSFFTRGLLMIVDALTFFM